MMTREFSKEDERMTLEPSDGIVRLYWPTNISVSDGDVVKLHVLELPKQDQWDRRMHAFLVTEGELAVGGLLPQLMVWAATWMPMKLSCQKAWQRAAKELIGKIGCHRKFIQSSYLLGGHLEISSTSSIRGPAYAPCWCMGMNDGQTLPLQVVLFDPWLWEPRVEGRLSVHVGLDSIFKPRPSVSTVSLWSYRRGEGPQDVISKSINTGT